MRISDTAALNQQALALRFRDLGVSQSALAEQLFVSRLTVGRWLSGRVLRISRENLERLAAALSCSPAELSRPVAAALAPQPEDLSAATKLLVSEQSLAMFTSGAMLDEYRQLLQAMAHPQASNDDMLSLYTMLTYLAARQGDFSSIQRYCRLKRRYAERCGELQLELEARMNLTLLEVVRGQVLSGYRGLLRLLALAESLGVEESASGALINLTQLLRLLGRPTRALSCGLQALRLLHADPRRSFEQAVALCNLAWLALECGDFESARQARLRAEDLLDKRVMPHERAAFALFLLLLDSLSHGAEPDSGKLDGLLGEWQRAPSIDPGFAIWPAVILRRCGRLDEAGRWLEGLKEHPGLSIYEPPFILEERARLTAALGHLRLARKLRAQANQAFVAFGLQRRQQADPAVELGAAMKLPAKSLRALHLALSQ